MCAMLCSTQGTLRGLLPSSNFYGNFLYVVVIDISLQPPLSCRINKPYDRVYFHEFYVTAGWRGLRRMRMENRYYLEPFAFSKTICVHQFSRVHTKCDWGLINVSHRKNFNYCVVLTQ